MVPDDAATKNTTDLRRARQRARSVVRTMQDEIVAFLESNGIQLLTEREYQRLNEQLSLLSGRTFRNRLVRWLEQRRRTTIARAIRAAIQVMQQVFVGEVPEDAFAGTSGLSPQDEALNQEISQIDAGLLYADDGSLATEVGNRITRQLRLGFAQGEGVSELKDRVVYIMTEGSAEGREETGVSGQTVKSKAELIAHDSIQDAYTTAATRRYLNNGFKYAIYDAVIDFKTSDMCTRMNEYVINLVETPWLVPPLHPWCRSGIRPILDIEAADKTIVGKKDIADHFLGTIMATQSYRPTVLDTDDAFRPTNLTDQFSPT